MVIFEYAPPPPPPPAFPPPPFPPPPPAPMVSIVLDEVQSAGTVQLVPVVRKITVVAALTVSVRIPKTKTTMSREAVTYERYFID